MEIGWEGHVAGVFEGHEPGRVHELPDGSRWRQEDRTLEHVHRERPRARLLHDRGTGLTFLDVEGTSGIVWVVPDAGKSGGGATPVGITEIGPPRTTASPADETTTPQPSCQAPSSLRTVTSWPRW